MKSVTLDQRDYSDLSKFLEAIDEVKQPLTKYAGQIVDGDRMEDIDGLSGVMNFQHRGELLATATTQEFNRGLPGSYAIIEFTTFFD